MTQSGDGSPPLSAVEQDLCRVRLLGTQVELWARTQEYADDLLREFALIALGERPGERELPTRLTSILQELSNRYGNLGGAQQERLEAAAEKGEKQIGVLEYEVPASVGAVAVQLAELLDEADEYCRQGEHLLSLASPPEIRAFRWWLLDEFRRQVDGEPPAAWADSAWARGVVGGSTGGDGATGRKERS